MKQENRKELDNFSYSIVIRTLGNTGDKYRTMLRAIERQTLRPSEVVVVLPEGCMPDHTLGYERVVHCKKGMVTQRAVGIAEASADYMLVVDDDLDFPPDFVERLHATLTKRNLDCVLAYSGVPDAPSEHVRVMFKQKLKRKLMRLRGAFTGQVFYSNRKSPFFDTIASTGGHRTYVNCPEGLCQTGCFQCFFIKSDKAKAVKFEEEVWLEQGSISSYAAYDDAVFFYKLYLQGGRIAYASDTGYTHLDAAAGRQAKDRLSARRIRLYTIARNRTIFWRRLIWPSRKGLCTLAGGIYGMLNYALYSIVINLRPRHWPAIAALFHGYRDAFTYISNS